MTEIRLLSYLKTNISSLMIFHTMKKQHQNHNQNMNQNMNQNINQNLKKIFQKEYKQKTRKT